MAQLKFRPKSNWEAIAVLEKWMFKDTHPSDFTEILSSCTVLAK